MKTPGAGVPNLGNTLSVQAQPGALPVATTSCQAHKANNCINTAVSKEQKGDPLSSCVRSRLTC
jgi:hypothetical protein